MSTVRYSRFPLVLVFAFAACQGQLVSPDDKPEVPRPQFAQGDNDTWTVNDFGDAGDGTCDDTECTLREALAAADASGDRIAFAPGPVDIELASYLQLFEKSLTIDGEGRVTIRGGNQTRLFYISADNNPSTVTLKGLTLTEGNAGTEEGGAIRNVGTSTVNLENSTVISNTAERGGGIFSTWRLNIRGSTITSNHANQGGGVHGAGIGEVTIEGSTISGNSAGQGGGLFLLENTTTTVRRSTISGNRAGEESGDIEGGGIYAEGALTILSSTIVGNRAIGFKASGAGIMVRHNISVANSIIAANLNDGFTSNCARLVPNEVLSMGHNLSEGANTGCQFTQPSDVNIVDGQAFTEVLEESLSENGGLTKTHALIVRGRAVDAGYCPGQSADQRGLSRPIDDAVMPNALDGCDIGAYELQGPFVARTDLIISQTANKTSVKQGDLLTYTVRVRNLGPETAPNVVVTNVLSTGVTFVSATHAKGTHTAPPDGETGTVTWYLGDMADQANEFTEIKVTVRIKGRTTITNTASVASDAVDPNTANNSAALAVSVAAGSAKPPGKGK